MVNQDYDKLVKLIKEHKPNYIGDNPHKEYKQARKNASKR